MEDDQRTKMNRSNNANKSNGDDDTCTVVVAGSTIVVKDLCYSIKVPKQKEWKQVLKSVTAMFKPGVSAIMGPTGGGKTTLLDCMAARKDPAGVSGVVLVDGKLQPSNFKLISGYVEQEDLIMGTLTVEENLYFSANLRLDKCIPMMAKQQKVKKVMEQLSISHVANSRIGTEFSRGVSGGEKKRAAIGMELVISPTVLFLDEPTTGLDAHTAGSVMELLYRLSQEGSTIICSIHQPRYSIFKLFHSLTLVCKGQLIYQGPGKEALEYFTGMGFVCEMHDNPADFFLDSLSSGRMPAGYQKVEGREDMDKNEVLAAAFHKAFKASAWHDSLQEDIKPYLPEIQRLQDMTSSQLAYEQEDGKTYKTGFGIQLYYVSKRALMNALRTPQSSIGQLMVLLILAVITGTLYFDVTDVTPVAIQNRVGAFFFIVMNQIFSNMSALELFNKERALFVRENSGGYYRVSAYFFAKVLCDMIPFRILPVILYSLITYFMVGFREGGVEFLTYLCTLELLGVCGVSVIFAYSAVSKHFAVANILSALTFVSMLIFGGFFVQLDSITPVVRWLQYFSFMRYGLNALTVNELKDRTLKGMRGNETIDLPNAGNKALEDFAIPYKKDIDLWSNYIAMVSLTLGFLSFAYFNLRRINKYK